MRWLTDDEYANVMKQAQTDEAQKAVTVTVAKMDGVVSKPAELAGGKPPAKPAAKPQEDDEPPAPAPKAKAAPAADEEPPAPAPKRTRGPNKPKPDATPPAPAEEVEEPVTRSAQAAKPAALAATNLASVVDDWDDE